nr:NADH dehydrogenase subunit 1 [Synchytrium endobioticum]
MIACLILILGVVLSVALMTLADRKTMGAMQRRIGPNKVGYLGILQPFADGIKLILKETVLPLHSSIWIFLGAPFLGFYLALLNWLVLPLGQGLVISELIGGGILVLIAISELNIYSVLFAGWSANSKYPFLGSLRSTAQLISYSVSLSLIFLSVILTLGTIELLEIMSAQRCFSLAFALFPMVILFMISAIAETNRAPFDLPEAESELVGGFFTEHSAISFAYFFLGEYTSILVICTLFHVLFFGVSMALPMIFFMLWIRASLARLRFDQLLKLGWSNILPFVIGYIMLLPTLIYTFDLVG